MKNVAEEEGEEEEDDDDEEEGECPLKIPTAGEV